MAWYIRRKCVETLKIDYEAELKWLNIVGIENQKNYQLWHHRKIILDLSEIYKYENDFLLGVFTLDSKNFHAWCHRIWTIRRFNLFDGEYEFIKLMLDKDCRNNSAWNYRYFIFSYTTEDTINPSILKKEFDFCFNYLNDIPKNESPFNYIRGFFTETKYKDHIKYQDFPELKETMIKMINEDDTNYHAYSLLLEIYQSEGQKEKCKELCEILQKIDVIRKKYWIWRQQRI